MTDIRMMSAAEEEYTEALCWYAERSQLAAEGLDAEFERVLKTIAADPGRFPLCDARHRYCSMQHYPFQVIYRWNAEEILIVAVAHAKRKPGFWSDR